MLSEQSWVISSCPLCLCVCVCMCGCVCRRPCVHELVYVSLLHPLCSLGRESGEDEGGSLPYAGRVGELWEVRACVRVLRVQTVICRGEDRGSIVWSKMVIALPC